MQDEYVRGQLRMALCDLPLMQKGQIAIMSETAAGDNYTDRPTRMVEVGGGEVKTDAEPFGYREGKKYKQNKPLILENTFQNSIWRQAVNKLPDMHLSWVKYCYGEELKFDHQLIICKHIWNRFLNITAQSGFKKMTNKTSEKVQKMLFLAVQVAVSQIRGGTKEYKAADLSRLLGIKPDNWQHNYLPRWSLLLDCCTGFDNEVIEHVRRQFRAERDGRRISRMSLHAGIQATPHPAQAGL